MYKNAQVNKKQIVRIQLSEFLTVNLRALQKLLQTHEAAGTPIADSIIQLVVNKIFGSENNPKLEAVGELVKTTYYFENGKVQQEGFFKNGKLEGFWTSYDTNGNKQSVATYKDGEKTGKWFFWNAETLSEVDYSQSRIASVKKWKQDALVNRN